MRAVRARRDARLDRWTGLCFAAVFFAEVSGLAASVLALPVSALALVDACAFDTGAFGRCDFDTGGFGTGAGAAGALAAGAGAGAAEDCASAGDVTANCRSRTPTAASAGRRIGGKVGSVTRDGESR